MRPTRLLTMLLAVAACTATTGQTATAAPAADPAATTRATQLDLPTPTGRLSVGVTDLHLTDHTRADPWSPAPAPRELMVRAWYPAIPITPRARYADEATSTAVADYLNAPIGGGVQPFLHRVRPNARQDAPLFGAGWPVLLYSHGRGSLRSVGAALAEDLASHGYVVLSVDHTYDAAAVRFPDGRVVRNNRSPNASEEERTEEARVRAADLRSTLDLLGTTRFHNRVDLTRVGALGHSIGGAAAAEAIRTDSRFRAGINLDGVMYGEISRTGVPAPFLMLSAERPDHPTITGWKASHQNWGRHFSLTGGAHASPMDLALFADLSGARELLRDRPELFDLLFGKVPGPRAAQLHRAYVLAFFQQHLFGIGNPLLDGPSPAYPEQVLRWSHS